jgi:hypothetical protein
MDRQRETEEQRRGLPPGGLTLLRGDDEQLLNQWTREVWRTLFGKVQLYVVQYGHVDAATNELLSHADDGLRTGAYVDLFDGMVVDGPLRGQAVLIREEDALSLLASTPEDAPENWGKMSLREKVIFLASNDKNLTRKHIAAKLGVSMEKLRKNSRQLPTEAAHLNKPGRRSDAS